ncbi:MAG: DNA repair protein RecO [Candidatus Aminicenantes bacterium]|nr:DNA repair protein RecO [Candidatus Aminicenantes bacterium]
MPGEQSEAVILRTFNLAEQDKIVVFLTPDKGIIKGVAKGAKKFGNRFGGSLEPLSLVKIFYYEKEGRDLVTISTADLIESFFDIQKDLQIYFSLSYFSELVEEFLPARSGDETLYRLLLASLKALKQGKEMNFLCRYFEAWILKITGILPDLSHCRSCGKIIPGDGWLSASKDGVYCDGCSPWKKDKISCGEITRFMEWVRKKPPTILDPPPFSPENLNAVGKVFQNLIIHHLEREPKTLRYLKTNT